MAEFEDKKISELERLTGELTPQSLFETAYTDDQREEGTYDTRAVNVEQLGRTVLNDIEYATELDTDDKTIFGAINELAQGGGGGGGSNVTIEDNPAGGVDLTVDGTTKTLANESDLATIKDDLTELETTVETDGQRITALENKPSGGTVKGVNDVLPNAQGMVYLTDATLPAEALDVEARNEIATVKELTVVTDTQDVIVEDKPIFIDGYMASNGRVYSSTDYIYNEMISVKEGDIIQPLRADKGIIASARFLTCYTNGVPNEEKGSNSGCTFPWTVPSGVDGVTFTLLTAYKPYNPYIQRETTTIEEKNIYADIISTVNKQIVSGNGTKDIFNLSANSNYETAYDTNDMLGYIISFVGYTSSLNGNLKIGRGYGIPYGCTIGIDSENLYFYMDDATTPSRTQPHGLTIKDYIGVTIDVSDTETKANLRLSTNGGSYVWNMPYFISARGTIKVSTTSDSFSNCSLSYYCRKYDTPTWVFGDSYVNFESNARWAYYLVKSGHTDYLLNGYGGRTSKIALACLKDILNFGVYPKKILWLLGMNDHDNGTNINSNWKEALTELMVICGERKIELILATIPNTPSPNTDNTAKNNYVKNSGYKYIDFAKSVNAESQNATWFDGMLSSDNVHPTAQGALALYHQVISDVPELLK